MKELLITQLSEYHIARFKTLLDKNQQQNALSIMQEYVVDGIEDDNYQWLFANNLFCLLYTSPSPRDATLSRMPSSA